MERTREYLEPVLEEAVNLCLGNSGTSAVTNMQPSECVEERFPLEGEAAIQRFWGYLAENTAILEVDEGKILCIAMGGKWDLNPAVVSLEIKDGICEMMVLAKEGLVKQYTAKNVAAELRTVAEGDYFGEKLFSQPGCASCSSCGEGGSDCCSSCSSCSDKAPEEE